MPKMRNALETKLEMSGIIIHHHLMGKSYLYITFRVVNELFFVVLLETKFFDRFIKSIHLVEMKVVPHHCFAVLIILLFEAGMKNKKK